MDMFSLMYFAFVWSSMQTVFGQTVETILDKSCYDVGDSMTLTGVYDGSDTIAGVVWYYSGKALQDIIVDTSCAVFQSDSGFPNSRITYKCPPNTADAKTYQLILSDLVANDLNEKTWGATFQVSAPSNPDVDKVQPTICERPCPCWCWWRRCYDHIGMCVFCWPLLILMIYIALYIVGIIIGLIWKNTKCCCKCFYHCKDSDCCECCQCCVSWKCGASYPCGVTQLTFWYQILWYTVIGIPVALGIYTIWRCCGRAENPGDSEQTEMDGEVTKR